MAIAIETGAARNTKWLAAVIALLLPADVALSQDTKGGTKSEFSGAPPAWKRCPGPACPANRPEPQIDSQRRGATERELRLRIERLERDLGRSSAR